MNFKEVQKAPIEGALNINTFAEDVSGVGYLVRHPKENLSVMEFITHEQDVIGFREHGGRFRRRTPFEQDAFIHNAATHGLRVLPPTYTNEDGESYYPFIENVQTLDVFLPQASPASAGHVLVQIFEDLHRAHSKGIVYGDRW